MRVLNNEELDQVNEETYQEDTEQEEVPEFNESQLANYVRKCWEAALDYKRPIQERLLANLRSYNSTYEPQKLAEIRKLDGSEVFMPLTATKCNAATAWINDVFFNAAGDRPWDIEATPMPELPLTVEEEIRREVMLDVINIVGQYGVATGQDPIQLLNKYKPQIVDRIFAKMQEYSDNTMDDLRRHLDDQLTEGNFYKAIKATILDLTVYEFACLKGPIYRKEKYFKRQLDPMTGTYSNQIAEKIRPTWERRSPFSIYTAPHSTGVNDDYVIDLISLTLKDLHSLIGLEGFKEEEIREVIEDYTDGSLVEYSNYQTDIETEVTRSTITVTTKKDRVDVIEFWGAIKGEFLLDWGLTEMEIDDPDKYYDVCVWLVGNRVIKAMLNPDPMGYKPFHICSYVMNNDAIIGGKGLTTLIDAFQTSCNAIARAIINNSVIASGPIVEFNDDKFPTGYDPAIYAWKTIGSSSGNMSDAPAVRFYQANPITEQLLRTYDYFSKLADQYSIPGYAHGDTQVGGAGNTASGLTMLMNAADRVVKNVIKNVDDMIASAIQLLYLYDMAFMADKFENLGDVKIVAKGSAALLKKEQEQSRRNEFLTITNNPVDVQILGPEVRRELLLEVAQGLHLDAVAKKFPIVDKIDELRMELQQIAAQQAAAMQPTGQNGGQVPGKKPPEEDAAGNVQSGQDNRQVTQEDAPQQRAKMA